MNLVGQHKPKYYLDAITCTEEAWALYYEHVETMIVTEKTGDENEISKMDALLSVAVELEKIQGDMYNRWQEEIRHNRMDLQAIVV